MDTDKKKGKLKVGKKNLDIPPAVKKALEDEFGLTDESLRITREFIKGINVKRIGFHGFEIDNYYEFIFKIDGDKFLDSHTEQYETMVTIDSVAVRIGTISEVGKFVIGCINPIMKSFYVENRVYHYLTISFECKHSKVNQILQYANALVNKLLSKGNSYITPDDVFKPDTDNDDLFLDDSNVPSLSELIAELIDLREYKYRTKGDAKLFSLVASTYHIDEKKRFFSYFKILEYLSRKQKKSRNESKFSNYFHGLDLQIKNSIINDVGNGVVYDDMIDYIRNLRNMMVHPAAKEKFNPSKYSMTTVVRFQKNLIEHLIGFKL